MPKKHVFLINSIPRKRVSQKIPPKIFVVKKTFNFAESTVKKNWAMSAKKMANLKKRPDYWK